MTVRAGIYELMRDLGDALTGDTQMNMLGGGNPAHIEPMQELFRGAMNSLMQNHNAFEKMVGDYDPPKGNPGFCERLATLLNQHYHLGITGENIAITNGSQATFSALFQTLINHHKNEEHILLPLVPEYIGYKDIRVHNRDIFKANAPIIEHTQNELFFKYQINFNTLKLTNGTRALCLSRPTNPSGNVVDDEAITKLAVLAKNNNIPLIIDSAYGQPFPDILFSPATLHYDDNTILCLSLSKLGLPGTRTGIVVANQDIIEQISNFNATHALAPGSLGPALMLELLKNNDLIAQCREKVQPFYAQRCQRAIELIKKYCQNLPIKVHAPEGALFLWMWCPDLPISSQVLYEELKHNNVLVISGHHFFPGLSQEISTNPHLTKIQKQQHECLRLSYAAEDNQLEKGIYTISEILKKHYK